MTSTEGYYPLKEEEDERKWAEMTNANEHNKASSLERAKAAFEAAEAAKKAAEEAEGAAEGEAKKEDGKEVPAEGAKEGEAPKKEEEKKALVQKESDVDAWGIAAKFNVLV